MKLDAFLFLCLLLCGCARLPVKKTDKLSILQGVTNTKEVEFSVVALKERALKFELRTAEGTIILPEVVTKVLRDHSPFAVHKLLFLRNPLEEYNLFVFEGDKLVDQRLVGKGPQLSPRLRLAVASNMSDYYPQHFKIWDELARRAPDYLVLLGDNVYVDKESATENVTSVAPERIWDRYVTVRFTLPLFFQEKLIPVHALWDDHDLGLEFMEASKEIFQTFYAQELAEDNWSKGHGVGGLLGLGDFNLYFLDGRFFRSQSPDGTHLGMEQYDWLMKGLALEAGPSILLKGDQFFGGYHEQDSYEGSHPGEFARFTSDLKQLKTPFIFMSGDQHYSEIMQFPRGLFSIPSFELTSGPLHAGLPEVIKDNPWRVVMKAQQNFLIIDNLAQDNHWFLDVESVGENGEVYFRRELAVYIKDLQDNLREVRKRRSGRRRFRRSRGR